MSEVAMTDVSMERFLLDMPYVALFEIFRMLSKGKLIEISKSCSNFRHVTEDTRLWKDVHIKYEPCRKPECKEFDCKELYSEPWPVNAIDLSYTKIKPSVSFKTDQVVKVKKLNVSSISANKVTMAAISTKYQCTELCFVSHYLFQKFNFLEVFSEMVSKQTALKVLSLGGRGRPFEELDAWGHLFNTPMLRLIENLPPSLEKLFLVEAPYLEGSFFELLAKTTPNLNELGLCSTKIPVRYPSLLKFKFLEDLHINAYNYQETIDFLEYLIQFPALKNVHIDYTTFEKYTETDLEYLRKKFESQGLNLRRTKRPEWSNPADGTLWEVS